MTPEDQTKLDESLTEAARILRKYTDREKLKDYESIEVEVRMQMLEVVALKIGNFFLRRGVEADREAKNGNQHYRDYQNQSEARERSGIDRENTHQPRVTKMLLAGVC